MAKRPRASSAARARRGRLVAALLALAVAFGVALVLRPFAIEALSADELRASAVSFAGGVPSGGDAEAALAQARAMNEELAARAEPDPLDDGAPEGYWGWAGADSRGRIATVEADAAGVIAPVWRGTSDADLSRGVGHLPGTSLPVGGPSTRCVLAGHTDYQDQTLFSRISKLQPGDEVLLTSVAGTLVYRVRGSRVIEPDDLGSLAIEPGEDLLTLLTCWPPSVNTQRLVVDCERAGTLEGPGAGGGALADPPWWRTGRAFCALCALAVALSGVATYLVARPRGRRRRAAKG